MSIGNGAASGVQDYVDYLIDDPDTHVIGLIVEQFRKPKALALDMCEAVGLPLPGVTGDTAATLRASIADFIPVSNPLDLTAQALVDPDLCRRALEALLADDAYGSVVLGIIQTDEATSRLKFDPIRAAIEALQPEKSIVFAGLGDGARVPPEYVERLRALGVPYFPSPDRTFRALAHLAGARVAETAEVAPVVIALPAAGGIIPEHRAKALLAPIGVAFPAGKLATSADEAAANADADAVRAGWVRMTADLDRNVPGLALDGILVEAMGARGLELIVGARGDPEWGPVILIGFGGIQAEILHDVRLLPPHLPKAAIEAELRALKSGALLDGYRGSPALDALILADRL